MTYNSWEKVERIESKGFGVIRPDLSLWHVFIGRPDCYSCWLCNREAKEHPDHAEGSAE